mmetsp:Transcript_17716/g.49156  ORF Transcript_17716/g.49156 Transcript_17716/m.49156 type:complete len:174 (-) Transcript_17716:210-731(-)|eukprot:CAMPEP_0198130360 /NCGR_PEP_ID=MMETSP1442-20131203/53786_1 /TAXON_ID= /ORGANISM="Craspedostauros australis, Strain CCMP3328" /LENGTH=173 /DNA_ID=CAMNT_0043790959 /DNA_START=149 /DNA_END=670 /DNA_ORIENTATION=+
MPVTVEIPKVEKTKVIGHLTNDGAFDMVSRFLATEQAKESDAGVSGKTLSASSFFQTWCDLRIACNAILGDDNEGDRDAVPTWHVPVEDDADDVMESPGRDGKRKSRRVSLDGNEERQKSAKRDRKDRKKKRERDEGGSKPKRAKRDRGKSENEETPPAAVKTEAGVTPKEEQ